MLRFVVGVVIGVSVGVAASAYAARVVGSGALDGWTVTRDGDEICSDPSVDWVMKRIDCE